MEIKAWQAVPSHGAPVPPRAGEQHSLPSRNRHIAATHSCTWTPEPVLIPARAGLCPRVIPAGPATARAQGWRRHSPGRGCWWLQPTGGLSCVPRDVQCWEQSWGSSLPVLPSTGTEATTCCRLQRSATAKASLPARELQPWGISWSRQTSSGRSVPTHSRSLGNRECLGHGQAGTNLKEQLEGLLENRKGDVSSHHA